MPPAVAAQNIGVRPCRGETFGDMLEAMARVASSQPNEAIARISPRSPMVGLSLGFSLSQVLPPDDHCSNLEARNFSEFNGASGEEQNFTRPS